MLLKNQNKKQQNKTNKNKNKTRQNCSNRIRTLSVNLQGFPFMENMLKYDFMKYRYRLLYYRVAPIYIRYTLYTTTKKTNLTPALKAKSFHLLPLRSESNLHFPHPAFGRSGCRLFNSTVIFLPDVSDVWKWPNPVKTLNIPSI
jgi:hypothetical protein